MLYRLVERSLRIRLRRQAGTRLRRFLSVSDLCQEAFVRALGGLDALREEADLEDFRRLLMQHAEWAVQDQGRRAAAFQGESAVGARTDRQRQPEERKMGPVTAADEIALVAALIEEMPPRYRSVFQLKMKGLTPKEIGSELGVELYAVRKRLLRGSLLLQEKRRLRERHPPEPKTPSDEETDDC